MFRAIARNGSTRTRVPRPLLALAENLPVTGRKPDARHADYPAEDNISSIPDKHEQGRFIPPLQHPLLFLLLPLLPPPRAFVLAENWSSTLIESRLNVMNASAGSADSPPSLA